MKKVCLLVRKIFKKIRGDLGILPRTAFILEVK